jgi:predicted dehydrogenase
VSKKRLCMVGAGRVGRLHTGSITQRLGHRAEVAALCDSQAEVAAQLAADFDIPSVTGSLEETLADQELDGVVITTPTFTHYELAMTAITAGLNVHLEKPMAMNVRECAEISAAAEQAGVALQIGFMRRFDQNFIDAAALLRSGEIGDPMIVKSLTHGPGLPPMWANDIATSNGMIAEVTSHDLDTICWFANSQPVDITVRVANFKGASRGISTPHFYDTLLATVSFESGVLGSVAGVCPADYGYDARVEVTCTGGMLQVGEQGPKGLASIKAGSGVRTEAVFASWRNRFAEAYVREMDEFVTAIDGGPVRVSGTDGRRTVALAVAGTLSMLEGRAVSVAQVDDPLFVPSWQVVGTKI